MIYLWPYRQDFRPWESVNRAAVQDLKVSLDGLTLIGLDPLKVPELNRENQENEAVSHLAQLHCKPRPEIILVLCFQAFSPISRSSSRVFKSIIQLSKLSLNQTITQVFHHS